MDIDRATAQRVLSLPMPENDADAPTIRAYLAKLLTLVWRDQEGFDGKRPFGNYGWAGDLRAALIAAGLVEGTLDEEGCIDEMTFDAEVRADALIAAAINELGEAG